MFMTPARASNLEGPPSPAVEPCLLLGSLSRKGLYLVHLPSQSQNLLYCVRVLECLQSGKITLLGGGPFQAGWNQLFPVILSILCRATHILQSWYLKSSFMIASTLDQYI